MFTDDCGFKDRYFGWASSYFHSVFQQTFPASFHLFLSGTEKVSNYIHVSESGHPLKEFPKNGRLVVVCQFLVSSSNSGHSHPDQFVHLKLS